MNSVLNSDSEQCTKSKLSRVHNTPTLGPGCAQAACTVPCCGARWAVTWPPPRPCRASAWLCRCAHAMSQRRVARCVARRATPCRSPSGRIARLLGSIVAHARPYRSFAVRRVAACLTIHPAARPPSCHDMPICIATHSQRLDHARARRSPCAQAGRVAALYRVCGWLYRSLAARPSTHSLGRIVAWFPCRVTIQYVVS